MSTQETIDQLIEYIDQAVARASVSNRQVAAVLDFLNQKLKSLDSSMSLDDVKNKGSESLPIYFDSEGTAHVIVSLDVPGMVVGRKGVAAGGISDFTISSTGQVSIDAVALDDILQETEEDVSRVPSAYAVKVLFQHIGIDRLDAFSPSATYSRGDAVRYNGFGYRFNTAKMPGPWDPSYCDRVDYRTLLEPLSITDANINSLQ